MEATSYNRGFLIAAGLSKAGLPKEIIEEIALSALEDELYNYPELLYLALSSMTEWDVSVQLCKYPRTAAFLANKPNRWQQFALEYTRNECERPLTNFYGEVMKETKAEKAMWIAMLPSQEWRIMLEYFAGDNQHEYTFWLHLVICWAIELGLFPDISDDLMERERNLWKSVCKMAVYYCNCPNVVRKFLTKVVMGNEVADYIYTSKNKEMLVNLKDVLFKLPEDSMSRMSREKMNFLEATY